MMPHGSENQPELFDFTDRTRPRPRMVGWRVAIIQMRHDHLLLLGVLGLIALTVIFSLGVERGKRLARTERAILAAPTSPQPDRAERILAVKSPAATPPTRSVSVVSETPKAQATPPTAHATPSTPRPGTGTSRYAIQLVTYSQPKLARRELARLHERGERAFLIMKPGRLVLYVGPFPSKEHASERLSKFRQQYRDCFIRTL